MPYTAALFLAIRRAGCAQNRADWMRQAKWGVMNRHLSDWHARVNKLTMTVASALAARGIKLMVYLLSGAPGQDKVADAALGWQNGPHPKYRVTA